MSIDQMQEAKLRAYNEYAEKLGRTFSEADLGPAAGVEAAPALPSEEKVDGDVMPAAKKLRMHGKGASKRLYLKECCAVTVYIHAARFCLYCKASLFAIT